MREQPRGMVSGLALALLSLAGGAAGQASPADGVVPAALDGTQGLVPTQLPAVPADAPNATGLAGGASAAPRGAVRDATGLDVPLGANDSAAPRPAPGANRSAAQGSLGAGPAGGAPREPPSAPVGSGPGPRAGAGAPAAPGKERAQAGPSPSPASGDAPLDAVMALGAFAPAVPIVAYLLGLGLLVLGARWVAARRAERDGKGP